MGCCFSLGTYRDVGWVLGWVVVLVGFVYVGSAWGVSIVCDVGAFVVGLLV